MELISKSVTEYVQSGEYFKDARDWYHKKYVFPVFERSALALIVIFTLLISSGLIINIYYLLPLKIRVEYLSYVSDALGKRTSIIQATEEPSSSIQSIAYLLAKNYVVQRERYDYADIKKQLLFIKNNSTKIVFKEFYDALSLTNPDSQIFKYKKNIIRSITPISYKFQELNNIAFTFHSKALSDRNEVIEDATWEANLSFEIDKIKTEATPGSRFGFIVTDYTLQQIKSNKE